jgi:hypothetical protein
VTPGVQAIGQQPGGIGAQGIFGLLHQRDKRHKPEPQHIAPGADLRQRLADDKSLARAGGRAQQARGRRGAQQRARQPFDQVTLKHLGL